MRQSAWEYWGQWECGVAGKERGSGRESQETGQISESDDWIGITYANDWEKLAWSKQTTVGTYWRPGATLTEYGYIHQEWSVDDGRGMGNSGAKAAAATVAAHNRTEYEWPHQQSARSCHSRDAQSSNIPIAAKYSCIHFLPHFCGKSNLNLAMAI